MQIISFKRSISLFITLFLVMAICVTNLLAQQKIKIAGKITFTQKARSTNGEEAQSARPFDLRDCPKGESFRSQGDLQGRGHGTDADDAENLRSQPQARRAAQAESGRAPRSQRIHPCRQ